MEQYRIIRREEIYKGTLLHMVKDTISLPDGREALRELVLHENASAVLPLDSDGNVLMVRQYRHPLGCETIEIPAGLLNSGEDSLACAVRELEEETGYRSDDVSHLFSIHSAVGFTNEKIDVYLAVNLLKTEQKLDDDEFINVQRYSPDELASMVKSGEITDAKTVAAIFWLTSWMNKKNE